MQRFPGPAGSLQNCGSEGFNCPIHDLAAVVLHVQKNLAMRIGPVEFRYGSLERQWMLYVVIRSPVMREYGNASDQKAGKQAKAL